MPNTYTMTQIARRMLEIDTSLGRWVPIASGNATTMVATRLATGGLPSSAYEQWNAVRREAASQPADRHRIVTAYTASSGTVTVATMADTTYTSENLELWAPGIDPQKVDLSVNWALNALRREDTVSLPVIKNQTRYPLGGLLAHERYPNDVVAVAWSDSPALGINRELQQWNTYSSTGVLTPPDGYVLAGTSATLTRSTTQTWKWPYSAALTRAGTDCTMTQTVGILPNGVDGDSLQGETVTVFGRVWASVASRAKVFVSDGTTTSSSTAHTGGSTWEELSEDATLSTTASTVTFGMTVVDGDATAYVGDLALVRGTLTDAMRRDTYRANKTVLDIDEWRFDQSLNVLELEPRSSGQWLVTCRRPYPQWPTASVAAGTHDAYLTDAPIEAVATVAVWKLYEMLGDPQGAAQWQKAAQGFMGRHLYQQPNPQGGVVPPFAFTAPARRWGR
jgi:hypothetical protein